jgi:small subunit ribosomal protein S2
MPSIPSLLEMLQAGVHFGHEKAKWHPKMEKFIFEDRQGIHIIDLEKTQKALEKACAFAKQTALRGGVILYVGTKKQASDIVRTSASSVGMPYVEKRWLGGTLTNYVNMAQLLRKYKELKRRQEKGELAKYTKFEQQKFSEQIKAYDDQIGGLIDMTRIPDAVFILDIRKDKTAITEAVRRGVKIIAICDTNVNPTDVTYPIPANDDATKSIEMIVKTLTAAIKEGRDEWEANRARLGSTLVQPGQPHQHARES